jgi:micrococcal nuclease
MPVTTITRNAAPKRAMREGHGPGSFVSEDFPLPDTSRRSQRHLAHQCPPETGRLDRAGVVVGDFPESCAQRQLSDSGPAPPSGEGIACRVMKVVDGDTIECAGVGRVRLIGIDTPERGQAPFGAQATAALAQLLDGARRIELETDVEQRDRYGRLLANVWVDGRMANWLLARSGWAVQLTYPPNVRYVERFSEAVTAARADNRGLWATGGFACEPKERRRGNC